MSKFDSVFTKILFKAIDTCSYPMVNLFRTSGGKELTFVKDVKYDDEACCKLDMFSYPLKKGDKYPVMFYIHGGGFVAGDKKYRKALSIWYAKQGLYVININYGIAPEYQFPKGLIHCVKAFNWMIENADKYNLDLNKIIISGDSAGAYYAAELLCILNNSKLQEIFKIKSEGKVFASILNCGVYDIETALNGKILLNMGEKLCKEFLGVSVKDIKTFNYFDYFSPIQWVNEKFPPSYIVYAGKDFFCGGHGQLLCKTLDGLKVYNECYGSSKFFDNHCFNLFWGKKEAKICNEKVKDFVSRVINDKLPINQTYIDINSIK